MPPLPSVPNVFKVAISGTDSGGNNWANVLHWSWSGSTPTSGTCASVADLVEGYWLSHITPLQSTGTVQTTVAVTDLTSPAAATGESLGSNTGTRVGDIIPGSAAFLMSYPGTGPRYRGGHPRTYLLVGVQADLANESSWTSEVVTTFTDAWLAFTGDVSDNVVDGTNIETQCAVSYYETDYSTTPHTRVRKAVPDVYVIGGYAGNAQLASQRGRIGRRRR